MYCFEIPEFLVVNELPIVVVGAGKATIFFEQYVRLNYNSIYDKIIHYIDDRHENIKMSKEVLPICKLAEDALYLIVTLRPNVASALKARLETIGVERSHIKLLLPEYPLTKTIWGVLGSDTKLKIVECGARGGNPNMNRLRFFIGDENISTIGFDPDEDECAKLNQIDSDYKAYPYIVDDTSNKKRVMYQILKDGCATFYKPNVQIVNRFEITEEENPVQIFREIETLNTIALDDWITQAKEDIDYLMINVDSAEYHVIKGAAEILKNNVCCVEVETHFGFFFDDAPSFAAVDSLMRNFECFELLDLQGSFLLHATLSPFRFEPRKLVHYNAFYCKYATEILRASEVGITKLLKTVSILEILDYQEIAFDMIITTYKTCVQNGDLANGLMLRNIIQKAYDRYCMFMPPAKKLEDIL